MKYYKTMRAEPLSLNRFLPAREPQVEILSEENLKARYRMEIVEIGKTYDRYAGLGVYVSHTIMEEIPAK